MFKLLAALRKHKRRGFPGGIHPPEMKTLSSATPIRQLPLPARLYVPIRQHLGPEGELCVKVGLRVLRGQPLTRGHGRMLPVHAPTSGVITAIAPHASAHPSGIPALCITLETDGEDEWVPRDGWPDYLQRDSRALIAKIHAAGVAGLGGAGFPTGVKLAGGKNRVTTLIINAAECEPYITADDRLMQDCAAEVIEGVRILAHILKPQQTIIGIEDNKPLAISMLRLVMDREYLPFMRLQVIPTKYPSGGARQLTQLLTGRRVSRGGHSPDAGVLMHNVGTAWAVKRAVVNGEALTERVVTITGGAVGRPGNVWARFGTPVRHLLENAAFRAGRDPFVIMGGPLTGFTLPSLDAPVVKTTHCLLAPDATELGKPSAERACIRCSACAEACPAGLLPQQLYWFSQGQQHEKAAACHLSDCIECGACAWVCPSHIPLVHYFRREKAEIRAIQDEKRRSAEAKARFEARQTRLEREKIARSARHQRAAARSNAADSEAIASALMRVRTHRDTLTRSIAQLHGACSDNRATVAAHAADATPHDAETRSEPLPDAETLTAPEPGHDPRKAAVAAAVARARARRKVAHPEEAASSATTHSPCED